MKHLGDICKINGAEVEPVSVIIGGSPCQDLSIAGKRAGLDGERSGLFMEQIRVIKEMRENDRNNGRTGEFCRPRYMVWENVPGAFSSNKGEDFRIVLEETAKIADPEISIPRPPQGKWTNAGAIMGRGYSIAWRVLDAQFWGVPQRRRRIALVADFGGQSAPEILFERKSLSGNIEPSGTERQGTAGDAESCTDTAISFQERAGCTGGVREYSFSTTEQEHSELSTISECYGISAYDSNAMKSSNPHSGVYKADTSRTLDNNGGNPACNQGGMAVVSVENHPADSRVKICDDGKVQALTSRMGTGGGNVPMVKEHPTCLTRRFSDVNIYENGITPTLEAGAGEGGNNMPMVMQAIGEYKQSEAASSLKMRDYKDATDSVVSYGLDRASFNRGMNAQYDFAVDEEKIGTQVAKGPGAVCCGMFPVVRRLTPMECERLQGYPDGWTDIGDWTDTKGKKRKEADSPRYKACGNSIAIPCWRFILQGISRRVTEHTMASLFDGIGGFPLIWEEINGSKSCRWVSEIEEFPIAVTKIRFEQE